MTSVTSMASTAAAAAGTGSAAIGNTGTNALASLSNNFSDFLSMLMTQLKNQDPSSPMDTNQFTSELVQFSQVEQQINTNQDLTQMIQLTQASQVEQSASMLGKQVTANSNQLSLQNGQAEINFSTSTAQNVGISVYNASGVAVASATVTSQAGVNHWSWNGQEANGATAPDGAYTVNVMAIGANGTNSQLPFTVTGTATAVQNNSGTVDLQMGGLTLPFSSVVSVGGG
jgi:flagellar basal-body rod modification protein FlgD